MEILLVVGRILFGGFFFMMGVMHFKNLKMMTGYASSKGVPMPALAVGLTGLMILLGGLGVILGIYVEISLILIALFLFFITPKMHTFWKETEPDKKMAEKMNFLKNMALLGATIIIWILFLG